MKGPPPTSILITGASSGIGAALARHYARPGAALWLGGRNQARLDAVAADCRGRGAATDVAAIDVMDRDAMRAWVARADAIDPLDLVIANAGVGAAARSGGETEADALRVLGINLMGVLNAFYPAVECMLRRGRGQIAVMSSLAGFRGLPSDPAYCASKAALRSFGEAQRPVLAGLGIRLSVICPGFVATPMTARNAFPMPFLVSAERAAAIIARRLARNRARIAFPWPLAAAVWLLAALPPAWTDPVLAGLRGRERARGRA
ncbi:MAG: SDR family NAD(P)-dependent oxidoreductase [Alphaproteobacteria bacterium]|nr:SDR family NAD(P)-dependent oxidoreductase [Alphaproteobacteria bacterium]MBV9860873.1 SDR family NAD(P)-dependent oxidoreductase [Alphaproteobacteria bacterium]